MDAIALRTLFFIPFFAVLLPVVALGIGIIVIIGTIDGIIQRRHWLRDLRRRGRTMPAAELLDAATSGTLIVDRPGINFKTTQCWWTNENALEMSPVPMPSDDDRLELCRETNELIAHDFDVWCWNRYISPDTGSAILVTPPRCGESMAKVIREHHPGLECVSSWSAIAALRWESQRRQN